MNLTKKAQAKFEKWYEKHPIRIQSDMNGLLATVVTFERLNPMFQWGVLQLFADSEGVELEVDRFWDFVDEQYKGYSHYVQWYSVKDPDAEYILAETRPEAWKAAVKKLDEIINEQ